MTVHYGVWIPTKQGFFLTTFTYFHRAGVTPVSRNGGLSLKTQTAKPKYKHFFIPGIIRRLKKKWNMKNIYVMAWATPSSAELTCQTNNNVWFQVLAAVMMNIHLFGILHHVNWLIITDFHEELTTSLFRIEQSDKWLQAFTAMLKIFTWSFLYVTTNVPPAHVP